MRAPSGSTFTTGDPAPSETPQVSVVIVTWNSGEIVVDCLEALRDHPPRVPWEVIVVDNGSADTTIDAVRRHPLAVSVIANRRNLGLATANNQGIGATDAPFVLLANPDTTVTPGAIDALLDLLERRQSAAFAVPRLSYPGGGLQTSAGDLPNLWEAVLGRQAQAWLGGAGTGFWWDGWAHDEERRIGRGHEAFYLVRRAAIDDIGLQDEAFRLDWEGVDWAARAADAGWEVWFSPAARVLHVGGGSIRKAPLRWIIGSHRGMYRYFAKRVIPVLRPALAVVIAVRGLLKTVGAAVGPATYARSHRR